MREISRELHVCFFGLQRPFSFLHDTTVWLTAGTVRAVKQTVVSLKLHAMSMCPDTTVWRTRALGRRSTKLSYLGEAGVAGDMVPGGYGSR